MKKNLWVFIIAAFAVLSLTSVKVWAQETETQPKTYESSNKSMLGLAADFGVFANEAYFNSHAEGNVACKVLSFQTIDATVSGQFYARTITGGNNFGISNKYSAYFAVPTELTLVVGSQYTSITKYNSNGCTISDGKSTLSFNGNNAKFTAYAEDSQTPFIDIDGEMNKLSALAANLMSMADTGATASFSGTSQRTIACNTTANLAVVSVKTSDLNGSEPIDITGLGNSDTILVINVIPDTKDIAFGKIYFDGKSSENTPALTARVLWNYGTYSGKISTNATFGGTILAPKAEVAIGGGNLVGSVIADKVYFGSELHFFPSDLIPRNSEVTVTISSKDGTNCPADYLVGVSAALYKQQNNGKYKKVAGSTKSFTGGEASATWTITEAGNYYVKEVATVDGFVQTPIKCVFTVTKADSNLSIEILADAKEGNGQSETGVVNNDKTAATFVLRHYSNAFYMIAYENKFGTLLDGYSYVVRSLDGSVVLNAVQAEGLGVDELYKVNIQKVGQYAIDMLENGEVVETKFVDFYFSPAGDLVCVEKDNAELAAAYEEILGSNYTITKIKASAAKKILNLSSKYGKSFEAMTDGCAFFEISENVK